MPPAHPVGVVSGTLADRLDERQNAKTKFENDKTGFREAMAFQSMTGSRGDRVILDDRCLRMMRIATLNFLLRSGPSLRHYRPASTTTNRQSSSSCSDSMSGIRPD